MSTNIYDLLNEHVNGASFVSLVTETVPKLRGGRKNPQQGRITKRTSGMTVMVFQNKNTNAYDNMVKRRLQKEGKNPDGFVLGERAWGKRVPNTPFVEHGESYYLEVICLHPGKTEYLMDGQPIPADMVEGLPPRQEGRQGGLEDKVIIRTFKIDSIKSITVDHETYEDLYFEKT